MQLLVSSVARPVEALWFQLYSFQLEGSALTNATEAFILHE